MSTNDPIDPQRRRDDDGDTRDLGDLRVSTGSQSAYITIEMILYVLAVLGVFITSAIIDEDGPGPGFSAVAGLVLRHAADRRVPRQPGTGQDQLARRQQPHLLTPRRQAGSGSASVRRSRCDGLLRGKVRVSTSWRHSTLSLMLWCWE